MISQRVLVTGGSGFIAGHCILQLLEQGHLVRATIRSLANETTVRGALQKAGMIHSDRLNFVAADLLRNDGWEEAVAGVESVLHVASPVQPGRVANEEALILPAREGTLRVLRAARNAGVSRVVLTSAFHAVSWGHPHGDHVFTEADWTVIDGPGVDAYGRSKTLAERAAWDFVAAEGGGLELTTMLPVAVMGPVIGEGVSGANHIVQRMLGGAMPVVPNLFIPVVDVRDVASAHVMAMTNPAAAGERFLLSNGRSLSLKEIGAVIRDALGNAAKRVPTRALPDVVVRIAARFNAEMRPFVSDLGYAKNTSNEKARQVLGWAPREPRDAIVAAAMSLAGNAR
jgi:nucleoside-diphosphate-sugar epimerase